MGELDSIVGVEVFAVDIAAGGIRVHHPPPQHQVIEMVGDSITVGQGTSLNYRQGLYDALNTADFDFEFTGVHNTPTITGSDSWRSNFTAVNGYRILDINTTLTNNAVSPVATLFLVFIGTNDAMHGLISGAQSAYTTLFQTLNTRSPTAKVIISRIPPFPVSPTWATVRAQLHAAMDAAIAAATFLPEIHVVDANLNSTMGTGDISLDGIHPSATGYAKIAASLSDAVQEMI